MPKIRDLGINAIPATARPLEVGSGGGGGGGCSEQHSPPPPGKDDQCGGEHSPAPGYGDNCEGAHSPPPRGQQGQQFNAQYKCGGEHSPPPYGQTQCNPFMHSPVQCVPHSPAQAQPIYIVYDQRQQHYMCGTPSPQQQYACPGPASPFPECLPHSPAQWKACPGPASPILECAPHSPVASGGGLSKDAIAQLKAQLEQQLQRLDEYEKGAGPKTVAEIDAREKELKAELEQLAKRRKELEK